METYVLKLAIDDSALKALEKRLGGLGSIAGAGTSSGGGSTGDVVKNITKLAAIATGVGGILALVKKITDMTITASPMLQAMLKLFDTSIMLILRPIGDFIGFTLRPILMYFLLYVALPFYRYFAPFMQKYGNALGQIFASPAGLSAIIAVGVAGVIAVVSKVIDGLSAIASKLGIGGGGGTTTGGTAGGTVGGKTGADFGGDPIKGVSLIDPNAGPIDPNAIKTTVTWVDQLKSLVDRIKSFASGKIPKQLIDLAKKFSDLIKALPGGALGLGFPLSNELKALLGIDGGGSTTAEAFSGGGNITSRFAGTSASLPSGFTQGSAPGSIGNPTFTLNINAGTIVDKQGLSDMINSQVKNQVPAIVQNSLRKTITK